MKKGKKIYEGKAKILYKGSKKNTAINKQCNQLNIHLKLIQIQDELTEFYLTNNRHYVPL